MLVIARFIVRFASLDVRPPVRSYPRDWWRVPFLLTWRVPCDKCQAPSFTAVVLFLFYSPPHLPSQGVPSLADQGGDLVMPARHLAAEDAHRQVQVGARIVEGESAAPRLRDMSKIFLGEGLCSRSRPSTRQERQTRHRGEARQEISGV